MGFDAAEPEKQKPTVDAEALLTELRRRVGLDQAFLARISHKFFFQALDEQAIQRVLVLQLERLSQTAEIRGYRLTWEPELIEHLASQWQPRFGVRFLTSMLRHRITEMLSVLEAQGTLADVASIRLAKLPMPGGDSPGLAGGVTWQREDDTLILSIT